MRSTDQHGGGNHPIHGMPQKHADSKWEILRNILNRRGLTRLGNPGFGLSFHQFLGHPFEEYGTFMRIREGGCWSLTSDFCVSSV